MKSVTTPAMFGVRAGICALILLFALPANAKVDPKYAHAEERGYSVVDDTVVFPDGSRCSLASFNSGTCGRKWMDVDYCVPEGRRVWHEDKCCDGLKAGMTFNTDGQKRCITPDKSDADDSGNWLDFLTGNISFWIGLLIPFLLVIIISVSVKRKMKQNK